MKKFRHLQYLVLLIAFDQFTKYLAVTKLMDQEPFVLIKNVFQFRYHENTGAVWGILNDKTYLLALVSFVIMIGILYFYIKIPSDKRYDLLKIVIVFIAAGALGNFIDRIFRQYVVDFLYFELIDFPIFNIADSYITVAAISLIILSIFVYKEEDFEFLSKKKDSSIDSKYEENHDKTAE
ncbi:MAG: hypothetical protein K0R92_2542 [Lachnospiraceae bacterium]|jgi:signal peptidase II|nr:hypothetical protein [Lachnospiraceae bacterium]